MDNVNSDNVADAGPQDVSPATMTALRQLFFRPTEFFRSVDLERGVAWWVAAWVVGIAAVADRVDQSLLKADLGRGQSSAIAVTDDWLTYWTLLLAGGVVLGAMIWIVGGWWYRVRVRWSSEKDPDLREAQLVYTFASLVSAVPTILYSVFATVRFPNYLAAWEDEGVVDGVLVWIVIAFVLWSYVVSYRGVRVRFAANKWPARVWFLILPIVLTLVMLGVLGGLYAVLAGGGLE